MLCFGCGKEEAVRGMPLGKACLELTEGSVDLRRLREQAKKRDEFARTFPDLVNKNKEVIRLREEQKEEALRSAYGIFESTWRQWQIAREYTEDADKDPQVNNLATACDKAMVLLMELLK